MGDPKKILNIIWNSLEKMNKQGLPRILKTNWIQLTDARELNHFISDMEAIGVCFEKWKGIGINIKHFIIDTISNKELKKANYNILDVDGYL